MLSDFTYIFQWWVMFFIVGAIFLPLTFLIFSNFFDKGYIFSKILGIGILSYFVFFFGILKVIPFIYPSILFFIFLFIIINLFIVKKNKQIIKSLKSLWKIFLFEEIIFFTLLTLLSYIRGFQPDIHGLEKYMDFGFVNSILRSEYFPPNDMWFTPFSINYYYFGHLLTAVLTKLSNIDPNITYNLMLATIFSLTFSASFSIGLNLFLVYEKKINAKSNTIHSILTGLLTGLIATFAGNLHTIYAFFKPYQNENPVPFWQLAFSPNTFHNSYWYPNATRFIQNTIHEFPLYSFVVSDLHGHVLDIPFVLLTIAILFSLIQKSKIKVTNQNSKLFGFIFPSLPFEICLLSFLLAVMYMTNAWDGIIYSLLTLIVFIYLAHKDKNYMLYAKHYALIIIGFFIFSLPFSINFKPFVSGIGVLCAPEFLTNIGKAGPFLFEKDHCLRSPIWQLFILHGFFYFWVVSFFVFIFKNSKFKNWKLLRNFKLEITNLNISDIFVLTLIFISTLLIIVPEFIYAKDIYPAHYRANTMFKLVYQSFIMLSIVSGYIIMRIISNFKNQKSNFKYWKFVYLFIGSISLFLVGIYPYFAINSYYGNLQMYYGLDGTAYLKRSYPADYEAITWLNKNVKGQPVILEAQGDSYTDYGRVSSNTGLPTILGWTVHEWLWRGSYDIPSPRIEEVKNLYESTDIGITKQIISKYKIDLIFLGDLEKQKYPLFNEEKFQILGKLIFQNNQTKIYQIY